MQYFFPTKVLSVRNEQRGTAEKHKGWKERINISHRSASRVILPRDDDGRPAAPHFRVFPASEKLGAVKLKIHLVVSTSRGLARGRVAVVREKLAGIYFLVKDPWRG